jgi:hypothetical protein
MPNLLIQPAKVPSVSQAARNALAIRNQEFQGQVAQEQLKGTKTRNMLAEKQLGSYDEDRETVKKQRHHQLEASAITAALKGTTQEQQRAFYESAGGTNPDLKFNIAAGDVELDYGVHTIKGPGAIVSEMFDVISKDPQWAENPKTWQWFTKNGGSMTKRDPKGTIETWGQPKEGLNEQGEPISYVTNKDGQVKVLSGVTPAAKKGMKIYDREGNLLVDMGGSGDIQKKTIGDLEKKVINTNEGLVRISNIVKSFKPEYQEIPTRLGVAWTDIKEKMGVDISGEDQQRLEEFSVYKQDSLENINLYIKEITGVQMSEKEAKRLKKAQPNPGEGIFDGDSPSEFKAKLVNQYKKLRAVSARYNYYLTTGIDEATLNKMVSNGAVVSLDKMNELINQRGKELEEEVKTQNPGMDTQSIMEQIKSRLAEEFGSQ